MLQTDDGKLWVATAVGLFQLDPGTREIIHYAPAHGLSERRILRMAEDPEGNLWLGTAQSGVMRLSRPGFVQFTPEDGHVPSWNPKLLSTRNGQLMIATADDSGGSRFLELRGRRFHEFWNAIPEANRSESYEPLALEDSEGHLWLSSGHLLYRFPSSDVLSRLRFAQPSRFALPIGDFYRRAHQSRNGDIWTALVTWGRDRIQPLSGRACSNMRSIAVCQAMRCGVLPRMRRAASTPARRKVLTASTLARPGFVTSLSMRGSPGDVLRRRSRTREVGSGSRPTTECRAPSRNEHLTNRR